MGTSKDIMDETRFPGEPGSVRTLIIELAHSFGMRLAPLAEEEMRLRLLQPGSPEARLATSKSWIHARRWRDKFLGCELFSDPAWDMMLDLYEKHHEAKSVTVTSACLAARVPTATAFRQLSRLTSCGLVERHDDGVDRRKVRVSLTPRALEAMDSVMDAALATERKLTSIPSAA